MGTYWEVVAVSHGVRLASVYLGKAEWPSPPAARPSNLQLHTDLPALGVPRDFGGLRVLRIGGPENFRVLSSSEGPSALCLLTSIVDLAREKRATLYRVQS